jgi:hypothetical protein
MESLRSLGSHPLFPPMNESSGFGYIGALPVLDPNSDCVGFEGSGSGDLPIVGGV